MRSSLFLMVLGSGLIFGIVGCGGEPALPPADIQKQNIEDELKANQTAQETAKGERPTRPRNAH